MASPALFGFEPTDWRDDTFLVEVLLRHALDDGGLRDLGRRVATFDVGALGLRFAGPWVAIALNPRTGREREALVALRTLLLQGLGDVLVEAVVWNAEHDDGPPPREPGPDLPYSQRPVDPDLPQLETSAVLESAVRDMRQSIEDAALDGFVEQAASEPVALRELAVTLPVAVPLPAPLRVLGWHRQVPGIGTWRVEGDVGRVLGIDWPADFRLGERAVHRGARVVFEATTRPRRHVRDEGPTELLLFDGASTRPCYRLPDRDRGIVGLAWVDDGHVAVGSRIRTVIVRVADGVEVASVSGGGPVTVGLGGRVVAGRIREGVRLLALHGEALVPLARYLHPEVSLGPVVDDLPTLRIGDRHWVPAALDAAWEGCRPKSKATPKGRKRAKKPLLVAMPYEELASAAGAPPLPADDRRAFSEAGFALWYSGTSRPRTSLRVGELQLGICSDGVAVRRGSGPLHLIRYVDPHGRGAKLQGRLHVVDDHVFAAAGNGVVRAHIDDPAFESVFDVLSVGTAGHLVDLTPAAPDRLVVLGSKGLCVATGSGPSMVPLGVVKISKAARLLVSRERDEAWVGADGKQRLVLVRLDGPKKVAGFTEDASEIRLGPDGWQAADPRRALAWRVATP